MGDAAAERGAKTGNCNPLYGERVASHLNVERHDVKVGHPAWLKTPLLPKTGRSGAPVSVA